METPDVELVRLRKRLHQERFAYWLMMVALAIALWWTNMGGMLHEIQIDGHAVAWVGRDTAAARAVAAAQEAWRKELGANVRFAQTPKIEAVKSAGRQPMSEPKAIEVVKAALHPEVTAAVIEVDGEPKAALKTKADGQQVLSEVRSELLGSPQNLVGEPRWKQRVSLTETYVSPQQIERSVPAVVERLLGNGSPDPPAPAATYVVKSGDNGSAIARTLGISLGELHRLNPRVDFLRLRIGQKLVARAGKRSGKPLLTLVTLRKHTFEEPVPPPPPEEVPSPTLAAGQRKWQQRARPGRHRVTEQITEENGVVIERRQTVVVSLEEPQAGVVLVGARAGKAAPPPGAKPAKSVPRRNAAETTGAQPPVMVRRPPQARRLPPPAPPLID